MRFLPILLWFIGLGSSAAMAQTKPSSRKAAEKKPSVKEEAAAKAKMFSYGVTTNTRSSLIGGAVLRHSSTIKERDVRSVNRYIALEAVNIKHPKEYTYSTLSPVIFGKSNYFFSLRPEYGREWYFFKPKEDQGIGFSTLLAVGPSIGIQRPYYIRYQVAQGEQPQIVPYVASIHTDLSRITSVSIWQNFFKNWQINPGVHFKAAMNFDANPFGDKITGIETGFTSEYFFKKPEIFSNDLATNQQFFVSAYVTLYFGSKKKPASGEPRLLGR